MAFDETALYEAITEEHGLEETDPELYEQPVCKHCGSGTVVSIEKATYYEYGARFREGRTGWVLDRDMTNWDSSSVEFDTIGAACADCGNEHTDPDEVMQSFADFLEQHDIARRDGPREPELEHTVGALTLTVRGAWGS